MTPSSDVTASLPSLFVVGFPKTGSTTLHQRLVAAGAVSATVKEPSVLLLDDRKVGDLIASYQRYYPSTDPGPRIDASPYYVYDTVALERVHTLDIATHVMVSVREPWSRLRSAYLDQFMQGYERRTLQEALDDELAEPPSIIERSGRDLSRRYLATTLYGRYVERLLAGPLGERTRLVSAETLDDTETVRDLSQWTGLDVPAVSERANEAKRVTSAMPALVHGTAERVGAAMPAWLHQRVAPVAKPIVGRLAALPMPNRRRPDLDVSPTTTALVSECFATSAELLRTVGAASWAGPVPGWLTD